MFPITLIQGKEKLIDFVRNHKEELHDLLKKEGAVLLRNFKIYAISEFQQVSAIICDQLMDYHYGSTPRTALGSKIYTSTEYPKDRTIPLHNENSYTKKWPNKILFYCAIEPQVGGETPIASSHEVFNLIDKDIRDKFIKKGIMYTRNYGSGMDLSWQQAFQTENKDEVMRFCDENAIIYQWSEQDKLYTQQVCQATLKHPSQDCNVWFNQAHLFHESANESELKDYFSQMPAHSLPRNSFFGDGEAFDVEELNKIRQAYDKAERSFSWKKGDLMILDNMLYCHGRKPFDGERKILVSMGN